MKPIIIKDTREQIGWNFPVSSWCGGMQIGTLKTGDYTIKGLEDILCIERKKSVEEISRNLGKLGKQFEAELERMSHIKYSFVVCEFTFWDLLNFPKFAKVPKVMAAKIKMTGAFMTRLITQHEIKYGVNFVFCGNVEGATTYTTNIFKRMVDFGYVK